MINIDQYMKKVGVTKKCYVLDWLQHDLIPGVQKDDKGVYWFPDSARRPYKSRCTPNSDAKTIRGAIVNACLKRHHISASTFYLSEKEFESYVTDLIRAGLIVQRDEDGIVYYDSTSKCDSLKEGTIKEIVKRVDQYVTPLLAVAANALTIGAALV